MYYSGDRIREFEVSTENLTADQINHLDIALQKPLRVLFIVAVVLFSVIIYFFFSYIHFQLLTRLILYLPFLADLIIEDINQTHFILFNIYFWSILLLISKGYHLTAQYYVSSKVKNLEIKNLEAKVKAMNKEVSSPSKRR